MVKNCEICGASFTDNSVNQVKNTCSKKCRQAYYLKRYPEKVFPRLIELRLNNFKRNGVTITDDDVKDITEKLSTGICEICGRKSNLRNTHIDHDHNLKVYRGVLCARCNHLLGYIEGESGRDVVEKALQYLDKHKRG